MSEGIGAWSSNLIMSLEALAITYVHLLKSDKITYNNKTKDIKELLTDEYYKIVKQYAAAIKSNPSIAVYIAEENSIDDLCFANKDICNCKCSGCFLTDDPVMALTGQFREIGIEEGDLIMGLYTLFKYIDEKIMAEAERLPQLNTK